MAASRPFRIIRLRVAIVGSDPEIWRTIDIDESLSLDQLHHVLQAAFGWQEMHLHQFSETDPHDFARGLPRIGRKPRLWVARWSLFEDAPEHAEDEAETTAREAFQLGGPIWYEYDFGDGWVHVIELIDRDVSRLGEGRATVVSGERRGPFEDSGGIDGYEEKLAIIADPAHPEHPSILEWARSIVGPWGAMDPDAVDLEGAQGEIDMFFSPREPDGSGLVDTRTGVTVDSPIAVFAGGLPVPTRVNLRRHLFSSGVLRSSPVSEQVARDLMRPFSWLLEKIGSEGIRLSSAGWMPPAVVLQGMTDLGWREEWIGTANREELTQPIRNLRAGAERLRLIRRTQGRLVLVARTRAVVADPALLYTEVARMLLRQRQTDVERLAGTLLVLGLADGSISARSDAATVVMEGLARFGVVEADGIPVRALWFRELTDPVLTVFEALGGPWTGRWDAPASEDMRAFARAALK